MNPIFQRFGLTAALGILFLLSACHQQPRITLITSLGKITMEIDTLRAPVTAGNFLKLVKAKAYHQSCFYRSVRPDNQSKNNVKIEVIQGGIYIDSLIEKFPTIVHETTEQTGIKHKNGTVSMARMQPGTASTEFFICIGDQPELDYDGKRNPDGQGFAAFGKVISGMKTVRAIQKQSDLDQYLVEPVVITGMIVEE